MIRPDVHQGLKVLHRLINQSDLVLATINNPHPSIASARESLTAALALTKDLIARNGEEALNHSAASLLGAKGGQTTAKRGSEYFRELAAKRKNRAGGRPKKT